MLTGNRRIGTAFAAGVIALALSGGLASAQTYGLATMQPGTLNHTSGSAIAKVLKEKGGMNMLIQPSQGESTLIPMVGRGEADIGIITESDIASGELLTLPCAQWTRCIITPPQHPLLKAGPLTLQKIAAYPLITYDFALTPDSPIKRAFDTAGIQPNVVLTAIAADVIKAYVELGMGIGILARMAFDPEHDRGVRMIDANHLFAASTTRLALRRNAYLRSYVYDFIELFSPSLSRTAVITALNAAATTVEAASP